MTIRKLTLLCFCLAAASARAELAPDTVDENDADRQQGLAFYREHRMTQAADLLEKVVVKHPSDMLAQESLGVALTSRAQTQSDPENARADRLNARRALLRAQELGDKSDLCRIVLAQLPESGDIPQLSSEASVDALLKAGEAEFAKGNWQAALAAYKQAWELEHNWLAALYIGDTYYALKDMDTAGIWFAQAVELGPNLNQGYRYWGDALLEQGKTPEARLKYIGAIVAEPYNSASSAGLNKWLNKNKLTLKKIPITLPPGPTVDANGKVVVNIDASMLSKPDTAANWLVYSSVRASWREKEFAKTYPDAKAYRHSLAEEEAALASALLVYRDSSGKKNKDESLDLLSKLQDEQLLSPYILLMHADEGIAEDYAAYRDAHRDKLFTFLDQYVVPPAR